MPILREPGALATPAGGEQLIGLRIVGTEPAQILAQGGAGLP
jgi:hypothetical protein